MMQIKIKLVQLASLMLICINLIQQSCHPQIEKQYVRNTTKRYNHFNRFGKPSKKYKKTSIKPFKMNQKKKITYRKKIRDKVIKTTEKYESDFFHLSVRLFQVVRLKKQFKNNCPQQLSLKNSCPLKTISVLKTVENFGAIFGPETIPVVIFLRNPFTNIPAQDS